MRSCLLVCAILIYEGPVKAASPVIFPHFVQGGGFQTSFTFNNLSNQSATILLDFYSQRGSLTGSMSLPLAGLGSSRYSLTGSGFVVGWARATVNPPVELAAMETIESFVIETSFAGAQPDTTLRVPVFERNGWGTGVALVNASDATSSVTFTLRNNDGGTVNSTGLSLPPSQQIARFASELFGGVSNFEDVLEIRGSRPVAATAFRLNLASGTFSAVPASAMPPEVLFSPRGGVAARIIQEIQQAQSSIDVAIYSFRRNEIADALIAAKWRGVDVRVLADSTEAALAGSDIAKLETARIPLKRAGGRGGGILHDKFAIFDGRLLLTGSYNWTTAAEDSNEENAVFLHDVSLVAAFQATFNSIWNSR